MKMENYTVQLNKENYFSVQSKLIEFGDETIRLVNLRSINGIIGEKFDLSDQKLQKIVHDYLKRSNNIELINIYSRKYNKFNWFEIYNNDEIINQSINELTENIQLADKFDESKVKNELKDSSGNLFPNKLYQNVHKNLPVFEKIDIDTCKFIPIWYINGSPKTKANCCELFTTFEILIHILSKRFISFKSILLDLSSTEIQESKNRNYSLEDYSGMRKRCLKDLLFKKDKIINELNEKIDKMNEKLDSYSKLIESQISKIENQTSKISSLESKLVGGLGVIQQMKEAQDLVSQYVQDSNNKQIEIFNKYIPPEAIGMKQTKETIMFIYSPSLNKTIKTEFPEEFEKDDVVLDTISCQTRDLENHLRKHKFDNKKDKIIIQKEFSNSLDLNKFIRRYSKHAKELKAKGKYFRKFIVNRFRIKEFKNEFNNYVNENYQNHKRIVYNLKGTSSNVSSVKNDTNELIQNYIYNEYHDTDEIENDLIVAKVDYLTKIVENFQSNQIETNKQIEKIENNQIETNKQIEKIENNQIETN